MEMQELEITIDGEGRVKVQVRGVRGTDCTKLTETLEESLGVVQKRNYLPEFYEPSHLDFRVSNTIRK